MMICSSCAINNQIVRIRGKYEMGTCPICLKHRELYTVLKGQSNRGDKRARDLAAIRRYDALLAGGGR